MKTFVDLTPNVAAAVKKLQKAEGLGLSEAVNALVTQGLPATLEKSNEPFKQRTADLGAKMDVTNVSEVLEALEQ